MTTIHTGVVPGGGLGTRLPPIWWPPMEALASEGCTARPYDVGIPDKHQPTVREYPSAS
jgi:hypothetical protein